MDGGVMWPGQRGVQRKWDVAADATIPRDEHADWQPGGLEPDPIGVADPSIRIKKWRRLEIKLAPEFADGIRRLLTAVDSDDRKALASLREISRLDGGQLFLTRNAPRCPERDQHGLPPEVRQCQMLAVNVSMPKRARPRGLPRGCRSEAARLQWLPPDQRPRHSQGSQAVVSSRRRRPCSLGQTQPPEQQTVDS